MRRALPPVVLAYHGVGDPPADDRLAIVMPPTHLEAQVRTLQRLGYQFVTADELADQRPGAPPPRGTAVLTFDDGWRDALSTVLPLLQRLGVPATFYINPGLWGGQHKDIAGPAGQLLSAEEARELAAGGMTLGCHALLHDDLRVLDDDALRTSIREGKAGVEAVTGRPCRTFAYPFGAYDDRVEAAVSAAGFTLAFAWLPGPWRATAAPRLPGPTRHGGLRLVLKILGIRRARSIGARAR